MPTYYLQTKADPMMWEEVDTFTFEHRTKVVESVDDENSRYSGNYVVVDKDEVSIEAPVITKSDLGVICRFLGIQPFQGARPQGVCSTPEFVVVKKAKTIILHEMNGQDWIRKPRRAA